MTSSTTSKEPYPTWADIIKALPARKLVGVAGSRALVKHVDGGFLVQIVVETSKDVEQRWADPDYRKVIEKLLLPWVLQHPKLDVRAFMGIAVKLVASHDEYDKQEAAIKAVSAELGGVMTAHAMNWRSR